MPNQSRTDGWFYSRAKSAQFDWNCVPDHQTPSWATPSIRSQPGVPVRPPTPERTGRVNICPILWRGVRAARWRWQRLWLDEQGFNRSGHSLVVFASYRVYSLTNQCMMLAYFANYIGFGCFWYTWTWHKLDLIDLDFIIRPQMHNYSFTL